MNSFDEYRIKNIPCSKKLASDLDKEQLQAVCAPLSNTCVFAVAGSGKTRVLTYRVANLIENGIDEKYMILLTFTNKASEEIKNRIKTLLNKNKCTVTAGTFHSVASFFVRKYAKEIDFDSNFSVIDDKTRNDYMKECRDTLIKSHSGRIKDTEFPSHTVLTSIYSGAINHNETFIKYMEKYYHFFKGETLDFILTVFEDYIARKESTNCLDFDDLLLSFLDLLNIEHVKQEINGYFKYVFVDEYQDINWLQYEIIEKLNSNQSLFVIGDSNQCIYQFRGSDDRYIDYFIKTHKDVNEYHLSYNYRSTPEILKVAETLINNNDVHRKVVLKTLNQSNIKPFVFGTYEIPIQLRIMAQNIRKHYKDELDKVAILVRKGTEIEEIKKALLIEDLPFNVKGNNNLLNKKYFNDICNILSFINNAANEPACKYVLKMFDTYKDNINKAYDYLKTINFDLNKFNINISYKITSAIKIFTNIKNKKFENISEIISEIWNSFYKQYVYTNYTGYQNIESDVNYLISFSTGFKSINQFTDFYLLERNKEKENKQQKAITIITMHKSKGLEWDYVYIPNLNNSWFPRSKDDDVASNTKQVQNERKLFYVAITRARKRLYLSYSQQDNEGKDLGVLPFIEEFEQESFNCDFFE